MGRYDPSLVDRVARAIRGYDAYPGQMPWHDVPDQDRAWFEGQAIAALDAMPQPAGWAVLVAGDETPTRRHCVLTKGRRAAVDLAAGADGTTECTVVALVEGVWPPA